MYAARCSSNNDREDKTVFEKVGKYEHAIYVTEDSHYGHFLTKILVE